MAISPTEHSDLIGHRQSVVDHHTEVAYAVNDTQHGRSREGFSDGGCKFSEVILNLHSQHRLFRAIPSYDINGRDGRRYVIRSSVYAITGAHSRECPTHADTWSHSRLALQSDTAPVLTMTTPPRWSRQQQQQQQL